jgi:hypothetical protein
MVKPNNIILVASALLSFCLNNAMESVLDITSDNYETIPTEEFITIEENFQKRFGYSIPTKEDDYTKTSFKKFIKHNPIVTSQEKQTQSQKIEFITKKSLHYFKQEEREKEIAAEKLRQETIAAAVKLRHEQQAAQEKQLREKLAVLQQLAHEKEAENKRLKQEQKDLEKKIEEEKKRQAIIELELQKHRIIEAQKKERQIKATQKAATPKQTVQRPQKNINAQRFALKKKLIASKDFRTEAQLKNSLYKFCVEEDTLCVASYINGTDTAFHYSKETGELKILIGKHEIDECTHCCDGL